MKSLILLFVLILPNSINGFGQDFERQLKENAIEIIQLDNLDTNVYNKLNPFRLIMLGEMHGTNEPCIFLNSLANLFTKYDDSVLVGFEIPNKEMTLFQTYRTDSSVYNSTFFQQENQDGRASKAMAKAIISLNKNPKIKIFFFDNSDDYLISDSMMYIDIKEHILLHPNWRTITLSGNIHNMLRPYKKELKTGYYLYNDSSLHLKDKMCSLNHFFAFGTMRNNTGNGLELKKIDYQPNVISNTLKKENYLFLYDEANSHHGFLYTKQVTASESIKTIE